MELGLTGKNALVCASSKGLGKGCARALAAEGVNVWLNGRDQAALEATRREIESIAQGDVSSICCSTSPRNRDGTRPCVKHPTLTYWVNNAGGAAGW